MSATTVLPLADKKALEALLRARAGAAALQLDGPICVRDNSVIYRARCATATSPDVAVKLCRDAHSGGPDPQAAREQFASLQRLSQALLGDARAVPQPGWLDEGQGLYTMAWVEGRSLSEHLLRRDLPAGQLPAALRAGGAWLGRFHRAGPLREERLDLYTMRRHVELMTASPVKAPLFERGLVALRGKLLALQGRPVHISWLYGDCKTDNLLLGPDGTITGIDIALPHENAVEHDLAQALNHAELLMLNPRRWRLRGQLDAVTAQFLRGYRDTGPALDPALLRWLRLWTALTAWHGRLVERPPGRLTAWILNRMFATLVLRLLRPAP